MTFQPLTTQPTTDGTTGTQPTIDLDRRQDARPDRPPYRRPASNRPSPRELSHQLRLESDGDLHRRRWIVGLSFLGSTMAQIVGLYQMGVIRRLPDPPFGPFDSSRVDASDYAYKRMQTPDALLVLGTYAVTAILAGAGGRNRAETHPYLPIAMAAKTASDAVVAVKLGREEWAENKALCAYCQVASAATMASAVLAVPEAVRAVRHLAGRHA
ncbi:MAG TPA: vitamin K epoxide reductase family protein [Azospirillaceae bacterium]|nr:vitamin K epoxide reductase family protein [Azospirillaceae bacterium]